MGSVSLIDEGRRVARWEEDDTDADEDSEQAVELHSEIWVEVPGISSRLKVYWTRVDGSKITV